MERDVHRLDRWEGRELWKPGEGEQIKLKASSGRKGAHPSMASSAVLDLPTDGMTGRYSGRRFLPYFPNSH
jgi:hypothetical protein